MNDVMPNKIKVSILMTTYNHEKYIVKAVDSILSQKVDFNYELIIGDDASTDCTQSLLKKHYGKDDRVVLVLRDNNLGSKKEGPTNFHLIREMARGEYIRLAEGDDYWVDENHLQKMVDWLDNHEEYIGIAGRRLLLSEKMGYICKGYDTGSDYSDINLTDYLNNPRMIDLMALLYRNYYNDKCYDYREYLANRHVGDLTILIYTLLHGKIFQIPDLVGVYRMDRAIGSFAYNDLYSEREIFHHHIELLTKLEMLLSNKLDFSSLYRKYTSDYIALIYSMKELNDTVDYMQTAGKMDCVSDLIADKKCKLSDLDEEIKALKKQKYELGEKFKVSLYWLKNKGKIEQSLKKRHIYKICVYGMRNFGDCLIDELRDSEINVVGIIDRDKEHVFCPGIDVFSPDDKLPEMDAIVVAANNSFVAIKELMSSKTSVPVLSIEQLLYE